jgi:hypothetical protein
VGTLLGLRTAFDGWAFRFALFHPIHCRFADRHRRLRSDVHQHRQWDASSRVLGCLGNSLVSLILRKVLGAGTPRELKNRTGQVFSRLLRLLLCRMETSSLLRWLSSTAGQQMTPSFRCRTSRHRPRFFITSATGC